jgi:signal peptidase II
LNNDASLKPSALPTIIGVAALVVAVDQISKFWVVQNLPLWASWSFSPDTARFVRLTFATNTGAAFGIFPQLSIIFLLVALAVIIGIIFFHHHLPVESLWVRLSLGLQLGGALGNLMDRMIRGFVVDFIEIGFLPIFNLADVAIVTGLAMLAYYFWQQEEVAAADQDFLNVSEGDGL